MDRQIQKIEDYIPPHQDWAIYLIMEMHFSEELVFETMKIRVEF